MKNKMTANDKLFFDMVWKACEHKDTNAANMVNAAITAFIKKPVQVMKKQIQAVGVSTDFAKLVSDAYSVIVEEDNFDLGYEKVFKDMPLGDREDSWDIYNVENGLTFRKIQEGQRLRIEGLKGTLVTAHVDYFGGALGWTDRMIRFRKVAAMVDIAGIFRNNFWRNKADNHYALIRAAGLLNPLLAWQGVAADGQLRRDIQTLNRAAFNLSNRLKDKGYGNTATAQLVLYANPLDKARINAAIKATTNQTLGVGIGTVGQQLDWNITVIYTYNQSIQAGTPLLVYPYYRLQKADAMQPTTFTAPKDPLTLNEVQAVWAIYGAVIADTEQVERFTLG